MSLDLQSVRCERFSLHAHFPVGQPGERMLAAACGAGFSKKRGSNEGRYSVAGRAYSVKLAIQRHVKGETTIDVVFRNAPEKPPKLKPELEIEKLWKCLDETAKRPTWRCRAFFVYPPEGFELKYRLPAALDSRMEGFSEIRGVRLVRLVEQKAVYSMIVDRPENEEVYCTLSFSMQITEHQTLAKEAFRNASEIVKLVVAPETARK